MNSNDIRRAFLDFFAQRGHRVVRSASLVPVGDPTLLFTNAGMNQFKDVFLGLDRRDYQRATSSQKCLRVSGKHNDLENVGHTRRHHTFFEMLGNFSFGDYFKQDAILFAWELMTEVYKLPAERLIPTVYEEDDDAFAIWEKEIGIPTDRIYRLGEEDNYWAMGDTGPCGPCSEIQYDAGPQSTEQGHKDCPFPCDCGRYVELWNLVFMQYNRDATGNLAALPKPSVDTGAGLERLATALQGKLSNYETDLFRPLIDHAAELTGAGYGQDAGADTALHVIADHSRAAMFVVGDGVLPSNEGRGYVLRKIMRRAIDYGRQLGQEEPFLFEMVGRVAELMREPYPELLESLQRIATVVKAEEEKYARLVVPAVSHISQKARADRSKELEQLQSAFSAAATSLGPKVKEQAEQIRQALVEISRRIEPPARFIAQQQKVMQKIAESASRQLQAAFSSMGKTHEPQLQQLREQVERLRETIAISSKELFYGYGTLGLRPDFIQDWAEAHGISVAPNATEGMQSLLEEERERAKASWKGVAKELASPIYQDLAREQPTAFEGYHQFVSHDCHVLAIVTPEGAVKEIGPETEAEVVLDHTPFYAESGGQVGDRGRFLSPDGQGVAEVHTTYHPLAGINAHKVRAKEKLAVGNRVSAIVDRVAREAAMRNHTGTHLLHAALRQVLGPHVKQAGSLVAPDRLRFDFSHYAALDPEELKEIERLANRQILRDSSVTEDRMNLDDALQSGALAFFGDKYPEKNVRVITVADPEEDAGFYSKELCGGTHVQHTGQIGVLKVVSESSTAAGVRRLEALTGDTALQEYQQSYETLRHVAEALHVAEVEVPAAIERLSQQAKQLEKELQAAKRRGAHQQVDELLGRVRQVKDVGVLSSVLEGVDRTTMRALADTLKQKLGSGVIVLGTDDDGKVALIAAVTKDLTNRLHAGKIAKEVAGRVGGTGGGRPDLAEAGGKEPGRLPQALEDVYSIVEKML